MRLPARRIIFPAILFCSACLVSPANSQIKSNKKEPVATVSGKVTIKGKPAPGIVVGMRLTRPEQFSPTFKGVTDQDGTYHIADVVAGSYQVAPVTPAFVISDVNNSSGLIVTITENENVKDVNFDLVRGGVITGRITDSDGRALIEQQVNLLFADQPNRGAGNYASTNFRTDDRGIYRMFGIRPGRYKVSVGSGDGDFFRANSRGRSMVPTTFYPDTPDATQATVIEVVEGTEANKIDIVTGAPPVEGFSVSGRIVNAETGKAVPGLNIGLSRIVTIDSRNTSSYSISTEVSSDAQGEFHLKDLRPGDYELQAYLPQESDLRHDDPSGRVKFQIVNQDVAGLIVKLSQGASVSGMVVFEGGKNTEMMAGLAQSWISANTRSEGQGMSGRAGQLRPDGSFTLGGLSPGVVTFAVGGRDGNPLPISRIERDSVIQPNGVTIQSASEHIRGIRLVVASHNGSVRGTVKFENGPLLPGSRVAVQLLRSGGDPNMNLRQAEVDSRWHFLAQGLSAGDYELRVVVYIPGSNQRPPMTKQLVTVAEGAPTDVTVTVDLATTPKP